MTRPEKIVDTLRNISDSCLWCYLADAIYRKGTDQRNQDSNSDISDIAPCSIVESDRDWSDDEYRAKVWLEYEEYEDHPHIEKIRDTSHSKIREKCSSFFDEISKHDEESYFHELDRLERREPWEIDPSLGTIVLTPDDEYETEEYPSSEEYMTSKSLEKMNRNLGTDDHDHDTHRYMHDIASKVEVVIGLGEYSTGDHRRCHLER
jgi:hypothetical protein